MIIFPQHVQYPVLAFSKKRRRDSTRIIYEILLASKDGVSKTRAVQKSNLNFHLMKEYLSFLLDKKYLERMPNGSSYDQLRLTDKGERLLELLNQLEGEFRTFRTLGSKLPGEATKAKVWSQPREFVRSDQEYQISQAVTQVYALQGEVSNEQAEIERMLSLAQTLPDKNRLAEAHVWKSNHFTRVGRYEDAILEGQKALDLAHKTDDQSKVAGAMLVVGEAAAFLGQKDESLQYLSDALDNYEKREDHLGQANATRAIAQVYLKHNDFTRALAHANRALSLYREIRDVLGEDETLRYLGDICCAQGDYLQGLEYYEKVLKIRRDTGNRSREGGALGDIGDVYLFLGQYEKSLELHRQALAIDTEVAYRFGQVWDHHDLGVIQYHLGNLDQAREELTLALRHAKEINAPDLIVLSSNDLSKVLRNIGGKENLESALQIALEAARIGERYAFTFGQIAGESNVAMAYLALGNQREGLAHSEKAVRVLESFGPSEVQEEEILYNHYRALRDNQKLDEAKYYLKRAYDELMYKADKIKDPATRETFLTRVTINRSIISSLNGSDCLA